MKVLAVPDVHAPWQDVKQVEEIISAAKAERPDVVIQLGDFYDSYTFSRFSRNMDFITPADELRLGRESFQTFWSAVQWAAPNASCVQLLGNHDVRIRKQVSEKFPELNAVLTALDFESLWRAPGVELHLPARDFYWIDGVAYHHGDGIRSMAVGARVKECLSSIVHGHTHRAHIVWLPRWGGQQLFEMACGNIAYGSAIPLQYTASNVPSTTNGFGIIEDGRKPRFIPLD